MIKTWQKKAFKILEENPPSPLAAKIRLFIILLIFLNVLAVIFETVPGIGNRYSQLFLIFEILSVSIFTVEYLTRLWVCGQNPKYAGVLGKIKYAFSPFLLIDLLAILPSLLPFFIVVDLRVMRALRLVRIFRILKIGRYSSSMSTMANVIKNKKEELLITLFTVFILLTMASSLMYYFEHEAQPTVFSSIPATMWWGLITLTTVGYGDVYPVTSAGKLLGSFLAILGVGLFALPAAILASSFAEEIKRKKSDSKECPHCGR